jgi:two-component sensor histidine kinase
VPLLDNHEVIGLVMVANRKTDYDEHDREFVERVAAYLAPVLKARLQRDAHESALTAALAGKEVLLQEVHHRVKNNLQIIASLLNMQEETLPEAARRALDDSQRRVRSMALVHEQLYSSEQPDQLDFADYVSSLAADLFGAFNIDPQMVRIRLDLEPVVLQGDLAMPCGLILNELLTNALKYAFPEGRDGEMLVALRNGNGRVTLQVADNGIGLPHGFNEERPNSLGLNIVVILTKQLNGRMEYKSGSGADFTLSFPIPGC